MDCIRLYYLTVSIYILNVKNYVFVNPSNKTNYSDLERRIKGIRSILLTFHTSQTYEMNHGLIKSSSRYQNRQEGRGLLASGPVSDLDGPARNQAIWNNIEKG